MRLLSQDPDLLSSISMVETFGDIILTEIHGEYEVARQRPYLIKDLDDVWFVLGHFNRDQKNAGDGPFYMHVRKRDAEILNVGVHPVIKTPEEFREALLAQYSSDIVDAMYRPSRFRKDIRNIDLAQMFYGGVINSSEGACRFASLVVTSHARSAADHVFPLAAREVGGEWHVMRDGNDGGFEMRFSRRSAKVTSLRLPAA